jgi:hypothetical protein
VSAVKSSRRMQVGVGTRKVYRFIGMHSDQLDLRNTFKSEPPLQTPTTYYTAIPTPLLPGVEIHLIEKSIFPTKFSSTKGSGEILT